VLESEGTGTRVSVVDPRELMPEPLFAALAGEAADRLTAALAAVGDAVEETVA
jgi:hypothetical protein